MEGLRIVQFTPPGSGTSVDFGQGLTTGAPGSAEGTLTVSDIEAAHDELVSRGIEVSDIWHGPPFPVEARQPGPDPERSQLRIVRVLHRSRRQHVAGPGGHDPAPRPDERHRDGLRHPRRTWRARFGVPRPPTASTRSAPGARTCSTGQTKTRTGSTGTPPTWWPSRPGRTCLRDRSRARPGRRAPAAAGATRPPMRIDHQTLPGGT